MNKEKLKKIVKFLEVMGVTTIVALLGFMVNVQDFTMNIIDIGSIISREPKKLIATVQSYDMGQIYKTKKDTGEDSSIISAETMSIWNADLDLDDRKHFGTSLLDKFTDGDKEYYAYGCVIKCFIQNNTDKTIFLSSLTVNASDIKQINAPLLKFSYQNEYEGENIGKIKLFMGNIGWDNAKDFEFEILDENFLKIFSNISPNRAMQEVQYAYNGIPLINVSSSEIDGDLFIPAEGIKFSLKFRYRYNGQGWETKNFQDYILESNKTIHLLDSQASIGGGGCGKFALGINTNEKEFKSIPYMIDVEIAPNDTAKIYILIAPNRMCSLNYNIEFETNRSDTKICYTTKQPVNFWVPSVEPEVYNNITGNIDHQLKPILVQLDYENNYTIESKPLTTYFPYDVNCVFKEFNNMLES